MSRDHTRLPPAAARLMFPFAARLLALGLAAGVPGLAVAAGVPSEPTVTIRARKACFSDSVRVTGYVMPRREAYVTYPVEGYRVAEVLVQEGDTVSAGQELVRLARIAPEEGAAAGSPMAARMPATLALKAPDAGVVGRSTGQVGALTGPQAEPLVRLITDRELDLMVQVPSLYVTKVRQGAATRILTESGAALRGEVRLPATDVDPATQFGRALVSLPANAGLRPGQFAGALVDTASSCGIAVPRSAILRRSDLTSVQVMARDGRIDTRRVTIGFSSEDEVEIRSGLAEGEAVVANAGMAF
ncbi:efflux RND transporter periplasmic adaptor subunit [Methylobacterium nonmethylotrophicum]|uniref:HlyD family efflux transporter periplasmic adaptor subunit n=1 Tax=Methylobacterium nonmethylotrophicum TaxID=1141884 RepID=A0A4Z0NUQ5_9HYPH|nr:HlyD family efflux transporter periplasmic adaptor subunit [Methylobacterium nonmethylotrophicum]TGE01276.1 HlyD family efflux transporter periplasmic adaptor subunit [Methylobacterium nonmethylotrophicum]